MATSLNSALETLMARVESLRQSYEELRKRNDVLEQENTRLREAAEEAEKMKLQAETDAEFLAVSHKLADNPDTLVETRRIIAGLIRNIDRCIEMLKE